MNIEVKHKITKFNILQIIGRKWTTVTHGKFKNELIQRMSDIDVLGYINRGLIYNNHHHSRIKLYHFFNNFDYNDKSSFTFETLLCVKL